MEYVYNNYRLLDVLLYNTGCIWMNTQLFKLCTMLYSSQCDFKDKRLHDHVFFSFGYFLRSTALSLKNNGQVHLHLIIQYEKIRTFLIQYGKILDGHVVQIKNGHWINFIRCRIIKCMFCKLILFSMYMFYIDTFTILPQYKVCLYVSWVYDLFIWVL